MGALLFAAAGTLAWPAAWLYLLELGAAGLWVGLWLARVDPALLAERMAPFVSRSQRPWDRMFMVCVAIGFCAWFGLIGVDAVRFRGSHVPLWLSAAGAVAVFVDFWLTRLVFRANRFAAPVVKIQSERGHALTDTGPYAIVRHPMYGAAILYLAGTPLMLGSWWGLACVPLMVAALGYRAVKEERVLEEGLPGYRAYLQRVRYRFVPGIW
ncbi:methyltransferase family protein [Paraburkholderia caballeronis]|uniref:methyltransferase family protein n=1 Tax=Paraburkholderia caballeronis TaxID=416943 RepID=UPI001065108E|nr:isoprenylcysteine carboxylmethyltransferase family protein [Paraburkholderia caballeronis]